MSTAPNAPFDILVRKTDLRDVHTAAADTGRDTGLDEGQVLLAIDRFGLTSNNVTYAAFGSLMAYWDFFPAPDGNFGKVPVWGFATVEESAHSGLETGERIFGYFPMASHVVVTADQVSAGGFVDASPQRAGLPPVYNQYLRTTGDPGYDPSREDEQMIFRPLFFTAFLLDDFLRDEKLFGAKQVILSSASSKTALSLAWLLSSGAGCQVTGLTSSANRAFVEGLGIYDNTFDYADIASLDPSVPTVFVDMAGNAERRAAVHRHFADNLRYSCGVGGTHWTELAPDGELPGPAPVFFFAPTQIEKRTADWGAAGLQQRLAEAWLKFLEPLGGWITFRHLQGSEAIAEAFREMVDGKVDPAEALVLKTAAD